MAGVANCTSETPANTQIFKAPIRPLKTEFSSEKAVEIEIKKDELILIETGMIFDVCGTEMLCTAVGEDNAVIRSSMKAEDRTHLLGNKTKASKVIRKISHEEVQQFLAGENRAGLNRRQQTTNNEENTNTMKTTKTKAPKKTTSGAKKTTGSKIGGASDFVRECHGKGMTKTATFAATLEKYPAFAHDQAGLDSRWNTAERIAKNAAAKAKDEAKAAKAPAKAPAKKSTPAKAPAKKVKAPAKAPTKPAAAPAPEPSTAAPAQAEGESTEAPAA